MLKKAYSRSMSEQIKDETSRPKREIKEWYGRLEDAELFPDLKYWQAQDDKTKFNAVWEMVLEAHLIKGEDLRESRLQRFIEHFERRGS